MAVTVCFLLHLFWLGMRLTLVMKLRSASEHADRENERRPRSMAVDQTLPDWFRNLDGDSDGKLSRAEFVGTDEQFRRYDTDGDGFISAEEAKAADEDFRSQVPP